MASLGGENYTEGPYTVPTNGETQLSQAIIENQNLRKLLDDTINQFASQFEQANDDNNVLKRKVQQKREENDILRDQVNILQQERNLAYKSIRNEFEQKQQQEDIQNTSSKHHHHHHTPHTRKRHSSCSWEDRAGELQKQLLKNEEITNELFNQLQKQEIQKHNHKDLHTKKVDLIKDLKSLEQKLKKCQDDLKDEQEIRKSYIIKYKKERSISQDLRDKLKKKSSHVYDGDKTLNSKLIDLIFKIQNALSLWWNEFQDTLNDNNRISEEIIEDLQNWDFFNYPAWEDAINKFKQQQHNYGDVDQE